MWEATSSTMPSIPPGWYAASVSADGATLPLSVTDQTTPMEGQDFYVGSPGAAKITLARVAGSDRIGTSVATSQLEFPANGSASAVVLARSDTFPDALAGGPLAAHVGGPLLLTEPTGLDSQTQAEIQRVLPTGDTVYILGGTAALSSSIDTSLQNLGYRTQRIAGADRFATAVKIAQTIGVPAVVFEATGLNFPDALAGVPAAVARGGVVVLTNGTTQAPETANYLASLPSSLPRYALGGQAAAADPSATALAGADRYATAALVAQTFFPSPAAIGVSSGLAFPDALGAGAFLGKEGAPLLSVPTWGDLPSSTQGYLNQVSSSLTSGNVFGGTAAVTDNMVQQVEAAG